MSAAHTPSTLPDEAKDIHVSPSDIAVGVVIGRSSEFFDFFVFAIASVIVFPARYFSFADPLTATLWSFTVFALAFLARPLGTAFFTVIDRRHGKSAKLTLALLILGTSTVGMGLIPSYENIGAASIWLLCLLRIGQGFALGGAWDGLPSLLNMNAPKGRRGLYTMMPQLGAPVGLAVASLLFAYLLSNMSQADFLDWGWRYPFFVAFAINVVALFARLRIVVTPEYTEAFETRHLNPSSFRAAFRQDGRMILIGAFVPLASFALFHMVTVFPLSWVYLYTSENPAGFLVIQAIAAGWGFLAIAASGLLADRIGHRKLLYRGAIAIAIFSLVAPLLLSGDKLGEAVYMTVGFIVLGVSFGQSSGAVASLFDPARRYTDSAVVSDLAWLFGAGFAPLAALALSSWLGLPAAGLYLLSGAVCTVLALRFARRIEFGRS
ncbi:MFS transporter (plasmid) [Paracoccus yeei]|jgi:MFS family permease|uniref:MFS transporter n=1 Tax=Paracoccus yeei TaxID=147645 RepID=A0A1V0GMK5_9RHOB|nr:MFS transporter [Paracoccus yeei]ARC35050.1 MFS transporter [Paracoccus yeei]ATQ58010.1 MFS transporter [Paracoccus yeei]OWJ94496.1 MFS transporter [Paracoccus yeei]